MPDQTKENRLALGSNTIWGFRFLVTRAALIVVGVWLVTRSGK